MFQNEEDKYAEYVAEWEADPDHEGDEPLSFEEWYDTLYDNY